MTAMTAALMFTMLVVPTAGLVTKPGCQSFLQRKQNPANSKNIEGEDCGNVNNIIGKWAKSKKVGNLAGAAQAAANEVEQAAKNAEAATNAAEKLAKAWSSSVPKALKAVIKVSSEAYGAANTAASGLKTAVTTFKGKFGDFAKTVTDADMVAMKAKITAAKVAAKDATAAAARATLKAEENKAATMKTSAGVEKAATKLIAEMTKLSESNVKLLAKSTEDQKSAVRMTGRVPDLSKTIKNSGDQKPVWEAYKADLAKQVEVVNAAKGKVAAAEKAAQKAAKTLFGEEGRMGALVTTKEQQTLRSESDSSAALGQGKDLDEADAEIRTYKQKVADLVAKLASMNKLADKLEATTKKIRTKAGLEDELSAPEKKAVESDDEDEEEDE